MPENKKADDLSVDDIIKDVMRKRRRESRGSSSSEPKANDSINVKSREIKSEDVNPQDYKSFFNNSKTDNSASKNSNMHHSKSDVDALKTQMDYMKKSLNETDDRDSDKEPSMSDMFANAVKKSGKKLSPAQQTAINEAKSAKHNKAESLAPAKNDELKSEVLSPLDSVKDYRTTISNMSEPVSSAEVADVEFGEDGTKPKRKKWSVKKKISVILCYVFGIIFLLGGAGISVLAYFAGQMDRTENNGIFEIFDLGQSEIGSDDTVDVIDYEQMLKDKLAKSAANVVSDKDVTNILLVGEDLRDTVDNNLQSYGNTDVIMMISVNTAKGTVTTTSFMRDIYLEIPDFYAQRINAAYSMGGIQLLEKTIQDNFSIKIDRFLKVNFYSFIDIVDTMGGLDIKVSDEEARGMASPLGEQNKYLGNAYGNDYIYKGGKIHMNGNQALAYARLRMVGRSDWERTQRQRTVIDLIANKTKNLSLTELKSLLDKVLGKISTDLTDADIAYYLLNSSKYLNYDRQQIQIPAEGTYSCDTIRGASVLSPDFDANIRILQQKIYGYTNVKDDETDNIGGYSDGTDTNSYDSYDSGSDTYEGYDSGGNNANTFY